MSRSAAITSPGSRLCGAAGGLISSFGRSRRILLKNPRCRAGEREPFQDADDRDASLDCGRLERASEIGAADRLQDVVGARPSKGPSKATRRNGSDWAVVGQFECGGATFR